MRRLRGSHENRVLVFSALNDQIAFDFNVLTSHLSNVLVSLSMLRWIHTAQRLFIKSQTKPKNQSIFTVGLTSLDRRFKHLFALGCNATLGIVGFRSTGPEFLTRRSPRAQEPSGEAAIQVEASKISEDTDPAIENSEKQ